MDEHPYIQLIERHAAAINRICRSFCPSAEDREDLRQDILLRLWQGWKTRRPSGNHFTWLYTVAFRTAVSWRRRQDRRPATVPLDSFDLPDDTALRELSTHLKALIAQLPAADQRLVNLYLDGFSAEEIGRLTGISQTNVTTRIGRIKEKLRKMNNT